MELIDIAGHSIDKNFLNDGCIIDIGCRGFAFCTSPYFKDKKIYAVDCDSEVFNNSPQDVVSLNVGIWDKQSETTYYKNGEATCLQPVWKGHTREQYGICRTITMAQLYEITGENVDVLKLDCEGAEYTILGENFKPIPKQISVEFHYHCFPELHNEHINSILERLKKNYDAVNLVWEQKHGAGFNFWDVLFIKK